MDFLIFIGFTVLLLALFFTAFGRFENKFSLYQEEK